MENEAKTETKPPRIVECPKCHGRAEAPPDGYYESWCYGHNAPVRMREVSRG